MYNLNFYLMLNKMNLVDFNFTPNFIRNMPHFYLFLSLFMTIIENDNHVKLTYHSYIIQLNK